MKRPLAAGDTDSSASVDEDTKKKIRPEGKEEEEGGMPLAAEAALLDDNLLYEVLRHVDDGRNLAKASCVNRQWKRTAQDERIWELICTRHYHRSPIQLRAVVLALGGFRQLYSSHLWPLLKPSSSTSPVTSSWPCIPLAPEPQSQTTATPKARWGKDEVNLSLSLLSIKYFEKMSFNNRNK
ncbi:F-box protein GID2-like [Primulina eburnea]|uniref:F-box protein GID2-like n=1 Tax=Primulina eburnea TaxID=1245227 RepID=UPI003C6C5F2F